MYMFNKRRCYIFILVLGYVVISEVIIIISLYDFPQVFFNKIPRQNYCTVGT